jgi:DNA-nicking Smr family endonuclease
VKKRDGSDDTCDTDAFARAMADANVVPLRKSHGRVRATSPVSLPPKTSTTRTDEAETDGESGVSFAAHGVDRREIQKLKRGEYVPADRYDLHGLTANAASTAVKAFLDTSRRHGHRCVCIVHGRGLRSPGGVAVLKTLVRALLRSHGAVLAFADAPRSDGGSGAVYLLLRRRT